MANVVVAENHLTFGGVAYFRGNTEEVEIGSIGEKRTPLTKQNYLEVKDRIPVPSIAIIKSTVVDIDFTKTSRSLTWMMISGVLANLLEFRKALRGQGCIVGKRNPQGVLTITGVATSITAFIGRAKRGSINEAEVINSFADYERIFGD